MISEGRRDRSKKLGPSSLRLTTHASTLPLSRDLSARNRARIQVHHVVSLLHDHLVSLSIDNNVRLLLHGNDCSMHRTIFATLVMFSSVIIRKDAGSTPTTLYPAMSLRTISELPSVYPSQRKRRATSSSTEDSTITSGQMLLKKETSTSVHIFPVRRMWLNLPGTLGLSTADSSYQHLLEELRIVLFRVGNVRISQHQYKLRFTHSAQYPLLQTSTSSTTQRHLSLSLSFSRHKYARFQQTKRLRFHRHECPHNTGWIRPYFCIPAGFIRRIILHNHLEPNCINLLSNHKCSVASKRKATLLPALVEAAVRSRPVLRSRLRLCRRLLSPRREAR